MNEVKFAILRDLLNHMCQELETLLSIIIIQITLQLKSGSSLKDPEPILR